MTANPLAPGWLVHPDDANALAPTVWPRNAARDAVGGIRLAGSMVTAAMTASAVTTSSQLRA